MKLEGEDREEGLVGEWNVGLLRRGTAVLIDGAVPDKVTAGREVLRGFANMVGDARVMNGLPPDRVSGEEDQLSVRPAQGSRGSGEGGVVESLGAGVLTAR